MRGRRLFLTVTAGRSGTRLLARLLTEVLQVDAEHEPAPRANLALRPALEDGAFALGWLAAAKLPAIAARSGATYIETSHLYCKGLIEPLWALGVRPGFIIVRRDARAIASSLFRMGTVPARTREGRLVLLDPSDRGTLPFPHWQRAGDYELCFWYALEIERRQAAYRERFIADGTPFVDVTIGELTSWDGFLRVARLVAPDADPAARRAEFDAIVAVDQHPAAAALPGLRDRRLPADLDAREDAVRAAVAAGAGRPRVVRARDTLLAALLPRNATVLEIDGETAPLDADVPRRCDALIVAGGTEGCAALRDAAVTLAAHRPVVLVRRAAPAAAVRAFESLDALHYAVFRTTGATLLAVPRERGHALPSSLARVLRLERVDDAHALAADVLGQAAKAT